MRGRSTRKRTPVAALMIGVFAMIGSIPACAPLQTLEAGLEPPPGLVDPSQDGVGHPLVGIKPPLAGLDPPPEVPEPPPVVPEPARAVPVYPGDNIQSKVDSAPAGTSFLIKAGLHRGQRIRPKSGNTFVGEPGAILDGGNAVRYAFDG